MNSDTQPKPTAEKRRRGRRPQDAGERRARVEKSLADLEAARVPFSMADLAERAGISRATLYRDAGLRDLVGAKGEGPAARPIDGPAHEKLRAHAGALEAERRTLRRALREAEKRLAVLEARNDELEAAAADAERARRVTGGTVSGSTAERMKADAYAQGFAAGARAAAGGQRGGGANAHGASAELFTVAARLPRPALIAARRTLARVLHPDLFAKDPATALLATELLKQINALAGSS